VTFNGYEVPRDYPAEIMRGQANKTIVLHGTTFDRIRYGNEPGWGGRTPMGCHDCAIAPGQLHLDGCDMESCPRCFGQLITCGCLCDDGPADEELIPYEVIDARYSAAPGIDST
jgi:hypothetical protein